MKNTIDYKIIGKNIRIARITKGYTQEKLANIIDGSTSYMSEIETGTSSPSLSILIKISKALDTTVDCLLGEIQSNINEEYVLKAKNILASCTDKECNLILGAMENIKENLQKNFR